MDDSGTTGEGGRWLNYAELAESRGITRKAAIRLTQRHQWRRQPGNDGATRVLVPNDIARRQTPRDHGTSDAVNKDPNSGSFQQATAAFESGLAVLREQLERAEARADALQAKLETSSRDEVVIRGELQQARQAVEALRQADDARKARGVLARLRAAWRGE